MRVSNVVITFIFEQTISRDEKQAVVYNGSLTVQYVLVLHTAIHPAPLE